MEVKWGNYMASRTLILLADEYQLTLERSHLFECVSPMSGIFRVFQPAPPKKDTCPGSQKFILIGWASQTGRLLSLPSPIRKQSSG
jgi:hypothetical protein